MQTYQRPWWLVVNKSTELTTTIQEETSPGERVFIIKGEPFIQGLAWLVWGPLGALGVVLILTWLAITLNVKEQSGTIKAMLILAYLGLPMLVWGLITVILNGLSKKYLAVERQAETEECVIRLRQTEGELMYQSTRHPVEQHLAYGDIQQVKALPPLGARDVKNLRLLVETAQGPAILLDETLGTRRQKNDLVTEIQKAIEAYVAS